jgi:septum site-determining protein MinD
MSKIIVIISGKGGVGKTTTAINLGAAMNYFGKDVLVIDGNLSTPNVGIHLNSPEVPVNLNHVLLKKAEASEAVYEHESGMKIMPSSLSIKELKKVKYEKLKDFKEDFKKLADYVILDSAAGLGIEAQAAIDLADEIIIVTNPELPAITDALKTIKIAEQLKTPVIGIIVTRVRKNKFEMHPESVKEMLEIPILGMIPEHIDIQKALSMKGAVVHVLPKSEPARAYKEIASRILDVEYDSNKDRPTLFYRIFKRRVPK